MASWIVPIPALKGRRGGSDTKRWGGKVAHAAMLDRERIEMPESWAISREAFDAHVESLSPSFEMRQLIRASTSNGGASLIAEAQAEIMRTPLPQSAMREFERFWSEVESRVPWGLAVRSSATCEDTTDASMAGLCESELGVRGPEAIAAAVRSVWASLVSPRALAYLAKRGVRDVSMAILIQAVVRGHASGVMLTQSFEAGRANERLINAAFGLGGAVHGDANVDVVRVSTDGTIVSRTIAEKRTARMIGPEGLTTQPVDDPRAASLSDRDVRRLIALAERIEAVDRRGWDIEFVVPEEGAAPVVVQIRPIVGAGYPQGGDAETVWSRVNVGESLPGVATPLTWSVAGAFSESGFRAAFDALGCSVPRGIVLVGNVWGRFYLNLTEFMRVAAQVPWLDPRGLVELGGGGGAELVSLQARSVKRRGFYRRLPLTAVRLLRDQVQLEGEVRNYEGHARASLRAFERIDLAIVPDEGIAKSLRELQALLARTGTTMLTCASTALGAHLALQMLVGRKKHEGARALAQTLTQGIADLESASPARELWLVADAVRSDESLAGALDDGGLPPLDAWPAGRALDRMRAYLDRYGDRAVREAELSTPRWKEDPTELVAMLSVVARGNSHDFPERRDRVQREAAEALARVEAELGAVERVILHQLISRVRRAAQLRESMRAWVTRVLGMLRRAFLEANRRLLRLARHAGVRTDGVMRDARTGDAIEAVFFLTIDEVVDVLTRSRSDWPALAAARRAEYERDRKRAEPPATFVGRPPPAVAGAPVGEVVTGVAASPGAVEGRARVLLDASEMRNFVAGEVLIVHATDVGWTPLFISAAAVVTELGGALSHAAIVARELGVPTVVNASHATSVFKTGDRVRVDGDRGTVTRVPES